MQASVRTSVVLGVIAALLLAFILFVERGSVTSTELEQRKGSALPNFVRTRVSTIEIQRKGQATRLVRDPDDLDEGGLWRVEAPFRAKADQEAVGTLLSALEFLDARRRLEGVSEADRKHFGLQTPRFRLWFTQGKTRIPVAVGNQTPSADGVYLQGAERKVAFVVGKDLVDALDHEPGDYHEKELHDGVLVATTVALSFRDTQNERAVRKRSDGLWVFEAPAVGQASAPVIAEVVNAFDALRAKHFVASDVKDLERYGLDHPRLELGLRKTRVLGSTTDNATNAGKVEPKREEVGMRLRVGGACTGHAGESYVTLDDKGSGSVSCALDTDLAKLDKSLTELRENRVLPIEDDEIQAVQVERGDRRLRLSKTQNGWLYEMSRAGTVQLKGEALSEAVTEWLKDLRGTKIDRFEPNTTGSARGANLLSLRVEAGKDKAAYELRIDASRGSELLAQRGDEPLGLVLAPNALALLQPVAARFRTLALLHIDESSVRAIDVRRGSTLERLSRPVGQTRFTLETPIRVPADSVAVAELMRLLCSLRAVRFVADAPAVEHGLGAAPIVVTIEHATSDPKAALVRTTLRLGSETSDGRFAQIEGEPGVFVAPGQVVQQLQEPLVSRTLLSTPLENIVALDFLRGGRRQRIERREQGFAAVGSSTFDAGMASKLAERVATLRATHVIGFGPATPAQGLRAPQARVAVTVRTQTGAVQRPYVLALGSEAPTGGRYARRDDYDVTFVLPKDAADELIDVRAK